VYGSGCGLSGGMTWFVAWVVWFGVGGGDAIRGAGIGFDGKDGITEYAVRYT
jgi:hypothetical protein